jgi:hypothetical protein
MIVERLVWYPDELDRRIVAELVARGGRLGGCVIARADLACLLEITSATLDRRIRALGRYGYVLRQRIRGNRGVRYHVVRVPDVRDVHVIGPAAARWRSLSETTPAPGKGGENAVDLICAECGQKVTGAGHKCPCAP